MKVSRVLLAGVLLTIAIPVCAQSLGELAKKEAERRKATPAAKVYTNDDLKKITVPGDTVADGKDTKATQDPTKDGKDAPDAKPAMGEAEWHARMNGAREDLRKGEMFRDALQSRINGLTADF